MDKVKTGLSGINELGMDMNPPGRTEHTVVMGQEKVWRLRLRNSGEMILLDQRDWEAVKDIRFYDTGTGVVSEKSVPLEVFLGLVGKRRNPLGAKYDYRRRWYS